MNYEIQHFIYDFGCECYSINTNDQIENFDSRIDREIFLGLRLIKFITLEIKVWKNQSM